MDKNQKVLNLNNGFNSHYWADVIQEANAQHAASTSLSNPEITPQPITKLKPVSLKKIKVPLGAQFNNTYFSFRESQCMLKLIEGKTMVRIGHDLQLSKRTVDYYINNMKKKINCRKKKELIDQILKSDFLANLSKQNLLSQST